MAASPSPTSKPTLVVHAGIPKCATSTLQMLLSRDDCAVARALGFVWLGKGVQPWAKGVAVSEMMYDTARVIETIEALELDPKAQYYISSEALSGRMDVFEALSQRFEITKIVLSIRLPLLMALSAYCYSGWLTHGPEDVPFAQRHNQIIAAIERIKQFGPVTLCPTEPDDLAQRFCHAIAGHVPKDIATYASKGGRANQSVPPVLAMMMNKVIVDEGLGPITGPRHANFTTVARNNPGRPRFRDVMPEPFASVFQDRDFCDAEILKYADLLRHSGVDEAIVASAVAKNQKSLNDMRDMPRTDPEMDGALLYRARWNLARVQEAYPDALPKEDKDLSHYLVTLEEALKQQG